MSGAGGSGGRVPTVKRTQTWQDQKPEHLQPQRWGKVALAWLRAGPAGSLPPYTVFPGEAKTGNQEDPVLVEPFRCKTEAAWDLESSFAQRSLYKDIHMALTCLPRGILAS